MTEHFVGKYEVEFKFRVETHEALLKSLLSQGAEEFVSNNREQDTYFERENGILAGQSLSMSVRSMDPSGIKLWIVKGPGSDRCEAVKIESVEKTCSMLETLGYHRAFTLEKTRSIYFLGQFHITLDVVAGLGCFAEIAVMTDEQEQLDELKSECLQLASRLGLESTGLEPRSYRQLLGHG